MLAELRARQLGVIDDLSLLLGPGMTALTGETGAGKTLVVEAIELLLGGRADPVMVRPGAAVAAVEGRFVGSDGGRETEVVLARVLPADGRGRAYIDGRMASTSALAEAAGPLVDLHGQHAHQSLLSPVAQREALDMAGGIDTSPVTAARARLRQVEGELAAIGGDPRVRARELDLLRFQLDELERAGLDDPDEETRLLAEQDRLASATALRDAAAAAYQALAGDGGAVDRLGDAVSVLPAGGSSLDRLRDRLRFLEEEVADAARLARQEAESLEDDPVRLADVGSRLRTLSELRRKYGDTLTEIMAYRDDVRRRAEELATHDERAARLERARSDAASDVAAAETRLGDDRRDAAGPFAAAVQAQLQDLAMPHARFEVEVGDGPAGDPVTWMLGANPGEPLLPLRKVVSGGELARTTLAVRLVLSGVEPAGNDEPPRTLIFDEVDAGVGGEAAAVVGRALAAVARRHQVLVVTHLAQVAACADAQVVMRKHVTDGRTTAFADLVTDEARVVELSRMLSGQPDSVTARRHAAELLHSPTGSHRRRSAGKRSRAR